LSEGGNVAPVVVDLRKQRDTKVNRNQKLLDEIEAAINSFSGIDDKTRAHEQVITAFGDREKEKKVQKL